MNESDFTSRIHAKIDKTLVKVWKIKDNYQGGVPDAMYLAKTNPEEILIPPLFIEYKYIKKLPKKESTLITPALSELQKEWLRVALISKASVYVIVGAQTGKTSSGAVFTTTDEWENGIPLSEFITRLVGYDKLAEFITSTLIKNR